MNQTSDIELYRNILAPRAKDAKISLDEAHRVVIALDMLASMNHIGANEAMASVADQLAQVPEYQKDMTLAARAYRKRARTLRQAEIAKVFPFAMCSIPCSVAGSSAV